jgi:hypothetical protein
LPRSKKAAKSRTGAGSGAKTTAQNVSINLDPTVVQRALNEALRTLNSPEYRDQVTKMTQSSLANSLQTFQRLTQLSGRLSRMDNQSIESVVNGSINDLTRAFLQYNSDQLVLLQKLSARTLEILNGQVSKQ